MDKHLPGVSLLCMILLRLFSSISFIGSCYFSPVTPGFQVELCEQAIEQFVQVGTLDWSHNPEYHIYRRQLRSLQTEAISNDPFDAITRRCPGNSFFTDDQAQSSAVHSSENGAHT